MSSQISSRRDFLKLTSAGVASTALGVTASSYANIVGANDRVRVAVCGVRGRGNDHIRGFAKVPGTDLAALCDVDETVLNQRLGEVEKRGLPKTFCPTREGKYQPEKFVKLQSGHIRGIYRSDLHNRMDKRSRLATTMGLCDDLYHNPQLKETGFFEKYGERRVRARGL